MSGQCPPPFSFCFPTTRPTQHHHNLDRPPVLRVILQSKSLGVASGAARQAVAEQRGNNGREEAEEAAMGAWRAQPKALEASGGDAQRARVWAGTWRSWAALVVVDKDGGNST